MPLPAKGRIRLSGGNNYIPLIRVHLAEMHAYQTV
jgi:hypothetical protein